MPERDSKISVALGDGGRREAEGVALGMTLGHGSGELLWGRDCF